MLITTLPGYSLVIANPGRNNKTQIIFPQNNILNKTVFSISPIDILHNDLTSLLTFESSLEPTIIHWWMVCGTSDFGRLDISTLQGKKFPNQISNCALNIKFFHFFASIFTYRRAIPNFLKVAYITKLSTPRRFYNKWNKVYEVYPDRDFVPPLPHSRNNFPRKSLSA